MFSLWQGTQIYRDLKLAFVATPTDPACQRQVVAFLAGVIRYARCWLLREHQDKYRHTLIVWKLAIGLPTAYHLDNELSQMFASIGRTAWLVSTMPGEITISLIESAKVRGKSVSEDVEVSVVPEIAAQIYGFVISNQFDQAAQNIYLMVDVGAGSVDSSLFQVKSARGGRWNFEFFTSVVEAHGVMNLHRHRVNWWQKALPNKGHDGTLLSSLGDLKFPTDREIAIPDAYTGYFSGIRVEFADSRRTPDATFYDQVRGQVQSKTFWQTWDNNLLPQTQLKGIPAFYCGGGMRMPFYNRLQKELMSFPNMTWLSANPRRIDRPKNLEAPGLKSEDYDRLTVAYGLSFLEVGNVIKAVPKPTLMSDQQTSWRDHYPDKDCC